MQWKRRENGRPTQIKVKDGVCYLSFSMLEETGLVRHGFSTRIGGVSEGIFSSMNLSFHRGDDRTKVLENYERMAWALGTKTDHMVLSCQTHTTNIRVVTAADKGKGIYREMDYTDIDGMVTNEPGIVLVTFYADCVPIYLVDIQKRAIGLCHSGWRGTAAKISQQCLEVMKREYGTDSADIRAVIGPSICQDCYEVSKDVVLEFEHAFGEKLCRTMVRKKDDEHYQLDLWRANALILQMAGVQACHITEPDLCTCCNSEYLFSHRASQGKRGNLAAFLEIIPPL